MAEPRPPPAEVAPSDEGDRHRRSLCGLGVSV